MSSDEHVRRLARELVLPDEADVVIQRPKYWSPAFCWLYFERVDKLIREAPEDGLVAAEVCPELVCLIEKESRASQDRLQLRASAILGTGHWATADLDRAEEMYRVAFGLIRKSESILQSDAANVLCRFSYVLCCQNRCESAIRVAGQSVDIYREAPADIRRRHLAEALAARGYAHHAHGQLAPAMRGWAEAVACVDEKPAYRTFCTVVHNLALGMQSCIPASDLSTVERYVTQACRSFSKKLLSVSKLKVCWLRGMIQMRFGSTRRGEATHRKVIDGFLQLGEIVDVALVNVTLGRQLFQEGRRAELERLAVDTGALCEGLRDQDAVSRAVLIWTEEVVTGTVTTEVFATTWRVLERASFERAAGLAPEVSAFPPRIKLNAHGSAERHIA